MSNSTGCDASSFYIAPGVKLLFSEFTLIAILADGTRVNITHRKTVKKLIDAGWDGTADITEKATGVSERITLDERVTAGKLPDHIAGLRVWQVLNGTSLAGVGGAKQFAEALFGVADSELGRKAFELILAAQAGDPDAWEKLVNLSRSNEASRHAWSKFLHSQDRDLHRTFGVEQADADNPGGRTQKAVDRIDWWVRALEHDVLAGSPQQRAEFLRGLLELGVMDAGDVPESVYEAEQRQAREEGEGHLELTDEYRAAKAAVFRTAQEESLTVWFDYLTSEAAAAAGYPMHARYWALSGVMRMGKLELVDDGDGGERARFSRRTAGTVAPFCELNHNVLAQTIEAMQHHVLQWQLTPQSTAARNARVTGRQAAPGTVRSINNTSSTLTDDEFYELVSGGNFSNIYTVFLNDYRARRAVSLENTAGKWVCYRQGSDAGELYGSLQGHTSEWCTAGAKSTAQNQLNGGDFWVFYSENEHGDQVVPRLAIRKDGNRIAEVRGCAKGQNLDPFISDVLTEKLQDTENFPNSEEYIQGAEDTGFLTDLERRLGACYDDDGFQKYLYADADLTPDELARLYELDEELVSNGYRDDPRADQIRAGRDFPSDLATVCGLDLTDHNEIALAAIAAGDGKAVAENLHKFEGLNHNEIALALIAAGAGRYVAENLRSFEGLDFEMALSIIAAGYGRLVADSLGSFEGLNHNEIARAIIAAGYGASVACNLDKFEGLNHTEIALELIADGEWWLVAGKIGSFDARSHNEIALALIAAGNGSAVIDNLNQFEGLDHNEIALALIAAGDGSAVAENLGSFDSLDHNEIALALIAAGEGKSVAKYLRSFKGLNSEVALALIAAEDGGSVAGTLRSFKGLNSDVTQSLIAAGVGGYVVNNLESFEGLDHREVALAIIAAGEGQWVARYIYQLEGLNHTEIALAIIAAGEGQSVATNVNRFEGLDHREVALAIIAARSGESVAENIDKFEGLNHSEIALAIIEAGNGGDVAKRLGRLEGLNSEVALALIAAGEGRFVANNLGRFEGLNLEVALAMIAVGYAMAVARNLDKFEGLNHNEIAQSLIAAGEGKFVAGSLGSFEGLNHNEAALAIIAAGDGRWVVDNLGSFEGLNHNEIALAMITAGDGWAVADNLGKFEGLNFEVALALIAAGNGRVVAKRVADNLGRFKGLNQEAALAIIKAREGWLVANNLGSFEGLNHCDVAQSLIAAGAGWAVAKNFDKFEGLNSEVALALIAAGEGGGVAKNLGRFEGLNSEVAQSLIAAGHGELVAKHLRSFEGLTQETLALLGVKQQ